MSNDTVEFLFKFLFGFAIFVAALVAIGFFLLLVKFILNFVPEIVVLGVKMTK